MTWTKLTAHCKKKDLDTVSAIVSMLDDGLLIEDLSDMKWNEMYGDLIDEAVLNADPDKCSVSIFISDDKNPLDYTAFLKDRFTSLSLDVKTELEGVKEEDWTTAWKKYYHPVKIGKVTVVPAWEDYKESSGEVVVRMDPGMAFGTGTHETTRLIIRALPELVKSGERVLDIGCGSGILSIIAKKLGADKCCAYDIDPDAVRVAKENAEKEGMDDIEIGVSNLLDNVNTSNGGFDIILANIVSDIILRLLPDMKRVMNNGAKAVLSGIINTRLDEIKAALEKYGYKITDETHENDWCGLTVEVK